MNTFVKIVVIAIVAGIVEGMIISASEAARPTNKANKAV